ncbi:MAG: lytic murein transglycosylase [Deltaproteobacteria bacterium]|nr:lytic murein transglycosylase [Deltaproteobacteria bacterium]
MRNRFKRTGKWIILTASLLTAGFFFLTDSGATVETQSHPFTTVQQRLIADGFEPLKIQQLYSRPQVSFEADGVILLFTYKEARVNYGQFTNKWSIRKANQYLQENKSDLTRIEEEFGVDKEVITAILLVETGLGASVGTRSALNTLSTMAALKDPTVRNRLWELIPDSKKISRKNFEKKADSRSKWAYRELKAFLEYTSREGLDPLSIPGSFAGAVGIAQFMPTSILAYGRDGNDDGMVDMLNHADSMASIANFLKSHGWRQGQSREKAEKIIYHYNHSSYYVNTILKISSRLKA